MRICCFGAFKPSYARNNLIRRGLELAGCSIVTCNVPTVWPSYRKYPALIVQYLRVWRECDVILVPEFGQTMVPLAWALGRLTGRQVVADLMVSLYEVSVVERQAVAPTRLAAQKLFLVDKLAGELANVVLTLSTAYKDYLSSFFGIPARKILVVPLGVNDEVFHPLPNPPHSLKLTVLYFGSFVPNHGIDVILRAADLLRTDEQILFQALGDGEGKTAAIALAARLNLPNFQFLPRVPFESVPTYIAAADIVLGVFGDTPQARKSMASKIVQGIGMRKALITGDTPAVREFFEPGEQIWLCPLGDPQALAVAIRTLAADEQLRQHLAERGYQRVSEQLTSAVIGQQLKSELVSRLGP